MSTPNQKGHTPVLSSMPKAVDDVTEQWLVAHVKNAKDIAPQHCDPKEIIESIRSDKLREPIEKIRSRFFATMCGSGGDRKKAKDAVDLAKKRLPGVMWSGSFSQRGAEHLIEHSGLLCADLDKLGARVPEIRERLVTSPHVWALFTSPTGDGLKAVFRVQADAEKHLRSFKGVEQHVSEICGEQIDKSCKDVSRLCFLSHDPDIYYNEYATVIAAVVEPEKPKTETPPPTGSQLTKRQEIAVEILGDIDWKDAETGLCTCPGKHLHNTGNAERDCRIKLDGAPTVFCLHNSCRGIIAGVNRELRARTAANNSKPEPLVCRLADLTGASVDDPNTLLGNRFLCRGGGLLFVGSSGIGKSTAAIQMGISWAIGRNCFGINPAKPLKILYVQAENDEADLSEMRDGVLEYFGELTSDERDKFQDNFVCVFESCRTGQELITALEPLLENHLPDLLMLDPALSYIGGNANDQEIVGGFLRNLLNPLLQKRGCGALIIHHTPKPRNDEGKNKVANDFAYAGTGSAEWANWPRAVLVLTAKDDNGLRELRIGKRFRLDWRDALGDRTTVKLLRQNTESASLFYRELSPDESILASNTASPTEKVLRAGVLPAEGESIEKKVLIARITKGKLCGDRLARNEVIPLLIDEGYLEEREVSRSGKRPAVCLVRTSKKPNVVSFAGV